MSVESPHPAYRPVLFKLATMAKTPKISKSPCGMWAPPALSSRLALPACLDTTSTAEHEYSSTGVVDLELHVLCERSGDRDGGSLYGNKVQRREAARLLAPY